jgi:taurine dioxygenase
MPAIPTIDLKHSAMIEQFGGKITALSPLGASVEGIDLSSPEPPPPEVIRALEVEMAKRGFLAFSDARLISVVFG